MLSEHERAWVCACARPHVCKHVPKSACETKCACCEEQEGKGAEKCSLLKGFVRPSDRELEATQPS